MYSKNIVAAGALLSVVAAVPMVKRDVVWVTETDNTVVTVPVTTTVWVNPSESVPTASTTLSHFGHHRSHVTTTVHSTVTVAAPSSSETSAESSAEAPSSYEASSTTSSSVYVAPTPSSTSVYVAPTTSTSEYVAPTTSTSVYVAPTTSTSVYVAPTPTSTYVAPTTSTTSSAPVETSSSSGGALSGAAASGTSYTGDFTWYDTGLGACGWTNSASDKIVAISESLFDQYTPSSGNPNDNPLCGKMLTLTGVDGSSYQAEIVDRCTGCKESDLDLSEDFFNTVTSNGNGRVSNMSWKFD